MKYDDIILQCCGDCEICAVYLECQYQTSSDDEKQKYLQLLVERDENLSTIANNDNNTELVTENLSETVDSEVFDQENNTEVTETTATDTPDGESNDNDNERQSQSEEFQSDVAPSDEVATQKEVLAPPDAQTVRNIYNEVFGIKALTTELVEAEANETTESSEEVKTVEAAETLQQPKTKTVESKKQNDDVTPITEETIKKIYNEVFGLTLQTVEQSVDNDDKTETNQQEVLEQTNTAQEKVKTNQPEQLTKTEESQTKQAVLEQPATTTATEEGQEQQEESVKEKATFKLTPPENNEELLANMCAKRGRKLIYKPNEPILTASFKVLGTDKKNDIGEKIKDILDAEIKQGVKVGYLDKFDGLSSAEIKEEYENDIVYEFAEQEFKKTGVIYDGSKIKVYVYDWDGKACHHVGYVDVNEAKDFIPYFTDKENYSFDVCGIITGGKGKRVVKEGSSVKIVKEKGEPIGVDVDIVVLNRKD